MRRLYPHRFWLAAICLCLFLLVISRPLTRVASAALNQRLQRIQAERTTIAHALENLHVDAAAAEELSQDIALDDVATYLAPVDRLKLTEQFEPLASAMRLDRFTYSLSPEQPYKTYPANADLDGVVESSLSLEAEAPHDGDVYRFLQELTALLPGHAQLRHVSISRLREDPSSFGAMNVKLSASIDWLANKAGGS